MLWGIPATLVGIEDARRSHERGVDQPLIKQVEAACSLGECVGDNELAVFDLT